jgi:hypothetical protein
VIAQPASGDCGSPEPLSFALHRRPAVAALQVVIDQAHGLHEGVHGGRAQERPAAASQQPFIMPSSCAYAAEGSAETQVPSRVASQIWPAAALLQVRGTTNGKEGSERRLGRRHHEQAPSAGSILHHCQLPDQRGRLP